MQPLAYAAIFAGAILLVAGVSASSITSVARGAPDHARAVAGGTQTTGGGAAAATLPGHPFAPAPSAAGSGRGGTPEMRAYVKAYSRNLGWSSADWEAVIERESGWNPNARNPSTGAYGIGQFNPENAANPFAPRPGSSAALYAHAGALSRDWRQQIKAMALYIYTVYHTPTNALAHENRYGWY